MSSLKTFRERRGWTQAMLAQQSGVPRSTISAIENGALTPSVSTALALARALGVSVENLFADETAGAFRWAWEPAQEPTAFWSADFQDGTWAYPVEWIPGAALTPHGIFEHGAARPFPEPKSRRTLVLASCDPLAGLLGITYKEQNDFDLLPLHRDSATALTLLQQGKIHVAGIHFAAFGREEEHCRWVREQLGEGYVLLRGGLWDEGVATRPGDGPNSLRECRSPRIRWIGRKPSSAARRTQDLVLGAGRAPRDVAETHWDAALAIRQGWRDAGICPRLVAAYARLRFFAVRRAVFDLVYPVSLEHDPRIIALRRTLRSAAYRRSLKALPGIDTASIGEEARL